jgi:hypothetical protein
MLRVARQSSARATLQRLETNPAFVKLAEISLRGPAEVESTTVR